ncbi:MAG: diversity-generating retroelement protein Avd [Candidatus Sericytochromatia bacterium]|nr:diversity-generating retroelement protein Avd [Candidatus Sericytochromatia bacterium]
MTQELPLFAHWSQFLNWLLNTTLKFPKRVRFTFVQRIDNLALDILELLIEARYSKHKKPLLTQINLKLEKLRVLLRCAYESQYLSLKAYEHASRELQLAGQMTGGWLKQQHNT